MSVPFSHVNISPKNMQEPPAHSPNCYCSAWFFYNSPSRLACKAVIWWPCIDCKVFCIFSQIHFCSCFPVYDHCSFSQWPICVSVQEMPFPPDVSCCDHASFMLAFLWSSWSLHFVAVIALLPMAYFQVPLQQRASKWKCTGHAMAVWCWFCLGFQILQFQQHQHELLRKEAACEHWFQYDPTVIQNEVSGMWTLVSIWPFRDSKSGKDDYKKADDMVKM